MGTLLRLNLLLCIALTFFPDLYCQNNGNEFIRELSVKFDNPEIKKLEKASETILEAEKSLQQARNAYAGLPEAEISFRTSPEYRQTIDLLYKASVLYSEGFCLAYSVFKARRDEFWKTMARSNHRASGMDKAIYYENLSDSEMKRSVIRFDQVRENDRFMYALSILNDAAELGKLSVRNAGRSLQILDDYPVEYNYGWDDDMTLEEIIKLTKDPNVNEPPSDIFATIDAGQAVDSTLLKEVIFKVQIAAHTGPLTEEYLASVYKGSIKIDLIFEENWYKYSIGRYLTYDEAEATRRECNIGKAFVVAYQEGKKIGTREALDIADRIRENSR